MVSVGVAVGVVEAVGEDIVVKPMIGRMGVATAMERSSLARLLSLRQTQSRMHGVNAQPQDPLLV